MKKNLYIMYAIAFLQGMVFYGPIATLYRQAQGISVFQITVIESISLALCILLEIPWGIVADKIGYKKTMIFCCGLYFISKIIFWQATGFFDFLSERIMLSIVLAGFSGVDSGIIYLSCKNGNSQKAFGIYNSMGMAGLLIASLIFSLLIQNNYHMAGFLTVVSYGIAAFLSFFLTEVKQKKSNKLCQEPFRVTLRKTLHNRTLILFLISVAFLSEAHQTITVFLNQLQYEQCGLNNAAIGVIYIIVTMLGLLGGYSSAITKRIGILLSFFLFCVLSILSCLTLAVTQYALPSVISIMTLRISDTMFQPFQSEIQNRQIKTANRATALSVNSIIINCVAIGTNLIFGALSEKSLTSAFLFGSGICTLSLFLLLVWHKKNPYQETNS